MCFYIFYVCHPFPLVLPKLGSTFSPGMSRLFKPSGTHLSPSWKCIFIFWDFWEGVGRFVLVCRSEMRLFTFDWVAHLGATRASKCRIVRTEIENGGIRQDLPLQYFWVALNYTFARTLQVIEGISCFNVGLWSPEKKRSYQHEPQFCFSHQPPIRSLVKESPSKNLNRAEHLGFWSCSSR